jgi:hypothetical protein
LPKHKRANGVTARLRSIVQRAGAPKILDSFEIPVRALARSHARALFLYAEQDRLRAEFRVAEEVLFSQLNSEARERHEIEIWPVAFTPSRASPRSSSVRYPGLRKFHPAQSERDDLRAPLQPSVQDS